MADFDIQYETSIWLLDKVQQSNQRICSNLTDIYINISYF